MRSNKTNITFPFCGTTKELQKYMESFNRGIAVKCQVCWTASAKVQVFL